MHADTLAPCCDELSLGAAFCNDSLTAIPIFAKRLNAARTVRFRCAFVRHQGTEAVQCGARAVQTAHPNAEIASAMVSC